MKKLVLLTISAGLIVAGVSCKKGCPDENATNYNPDANKSDGSCLYGIDYNVPETYEFKDEEGNSTVSYSGQTDRLNQLSEMADYMESGHTQTIDAQVLKDMFANTNDNGNGNFTFSSSKQLENKCFEIDVDMYKDYMDSIALASVDFASTASNGQAGTLSSGTSTYLFSPRGIEYAELIEKGLMGGVFMHQALNVYFGSDKMSVDNSTAVDATNGEYYTEMEHHFDEAFGYFGVPVSFPTNLGQDRFWGKYCNSRDAELNSNALMMDNFLLGRAAISNNDLETRDEAIQTIRETWELICAAQAVSYFEGALANFGTDQAKFLHELSEAYAFTQNLKYLPSSTRSISTTEVENILDMFDNFWNATSADISTAKTQLETIYNL